MITRKRSKRKPTGGLYIPSRKKRKSEIARPPAFTTVGALKRKSERVLGGHFKMRVLQADIVNVFDGKKFMKAKIKTVSENSANRNFIRQNIITKGAVVDTDHGMVKITSRPGQSGNLSGVLVKK
jgi:small subunit ribosomal protein S8e